MSFISPMEQYEIKNLLSIDFTQNNVIFYLLIASLITIFISNQTNPNIIGNWWVIQNESQYKTIQTMIEDFIGKDKTIYFPQIYTIFHIILFSNLQGLIPYSSTATVEMVMTLSISFTQQVGILQIGFTTHQNYLQAAFIPAGTPIFQVPIMLVQEILAYQIKIISLGLRQAINMTTGHILCKVSIGFIWSAYLKGVSIIIQGQPLILLTIFLALEILIAYLQAYIFVFITCITLKDMAN